MSVMIPAEVLRAASAPHGRMALVVGAGCSLDAPTSLRLGSSYAQRAHDELVLDGVLELGDCSDPTDLSLVASAVFAKTGAQSELVRRLPRNEFRMALANTGYLIAAALLREGVINAVLTLNFDLAMTSALSHLAAKEVSVVEGPAASSDLGQATVIYLHRNANENELENWILRKEALDDEWQNSWEQVVAQRVLSCPVVVFAGLGSPAAALTETAKRIRAAVSTGQHHVSVVDPYPNSKFAAALEPPPQAYVEAGWLPFMESLSGRYLQTLRQLMMSACQELCDRHGWSGETEPVSTVCSRLHSRNIVELGQIRAQWLLETEPYVPDDGRREMLADLILGVALLEQQLSATAAFSPDGVIYLERPNRSVIALRPASGRGSLRWSALEPLVAQKMRDAAGTQKVDYVLVSGYVGERQGVPLPDDLIEGDLTDDIITGPTQPVMMTVDEIRNDPVLTSRLGM